MANAWQNLIKKQRRKRLLKEKERIERAQGRQSGQNSPRVRRKSAEARRRESTIRIFVVCGIGVLVIAGIIVAATKRTYHNYKIVRTSEQEDVISTNYVELAGKILRYSPDGASLVSSKLQTVWSESYSMDNPVADVREDAAVIADIDGTTMEIFDKNGRTGSVTTSYSIVKARVSSGGLVAAILDGGDDTWINFYASDGSLIAENQTKIDDPGYPLDVAVSDSGVIMMVAYQFIDGGETTSYVAFYNFGEVGQNEDDKIVSGYTYDGVVVPQIEYLSGNKSVAIRDDGLTIYSGKEIPKEVSTINVEKEIVSTFYDDDLVGLVFKNDDEDYLYTMEVYTTNGKLKFTRDFNIPYTSIKISEGNIIMYNSSQISVVTANGTERYNGTVDGTIKDLFRLGLNRYLLVLDDGVSVIKFS